MGFYIFLYGTFAVYVIYERRKLKKELQRLQEWSEHLAEIEYQD